MAEKSEYHDNFLSVQVGARGSLDREAQKKLFDRIDWFDNLNRYALKDKELAIFSSNINGAAAWMPLMVKKYRHFEPLANWYNFTWQPIFCGPYDEVTKLSLLGNIAKLAKKSAYRISLSPLPNEENEVKLLTYAFKQAGWIISKQQCDVNHILRLKGRSFDDYWRDRPGQLRSTVKRKAKKEQVSIRIEKEFNSESWADYENIYAKSWKTSEGNPEFLRELAKQEADAGALRLGLAYIDGRCVAAQFWTVENGEALIHKLAHDEAYLSASPGTLLSAALFQYAIDIDRVDLIDFGTGDDKYKSDWMEEIRPRYSLDCFDPNMPLSWPYIAKHYLRRLAKNAK